MFDVSQVVTDRWPTLQAHPKLAKPLTQLLRRLLHEHDFHEFAERYPHLTGFDFVEQVLDYFNFDYRVRESERMRIPSQGRVVIIANHPIGSLDGLALIQLVKSVRPDVRIMANDLLMAVPPLTSLLLPVNNMGGQTSRSSCKRVLQHLQQDNALIIFPAGEVSRLRPTGIYDGQWHGGFLRLAMLTEAPILPIHIQARNSFLFYGTSLLYKPFSTVLLVKEMFHQRNKTITFHIGDPIPHASYTNTSLGFHERVRLFKRHVYRIGHHKKGCFKTFASVAHPEPRDQLAQAVGTCEALGSLPDGKQIYLYRYQDSSPIMRELGRLRELSFRAVGEGTGLKRDIDRYDRDYMHLLLWDPKQLEIVGAYRLAEARKVLNQRGEQGLYCHTLFNFSARMAPYLDAGLELGRSFVQPRYWGRRSLDYLWYGIGAFLQQYPQYRYLYGPVSISQQFPQAARDLLVYFYKMYFSVSEPAARHRRPYAWTNEAQQALQNQFTGTDYHRDFAHLKHLLANMGMAIPTLYKQYTELCEPGGVEFHDFGIDPDFADCVDGLVVVDITRIKPQKRARYLQ